MNVPSDATRETLIAMLVDLYKRLSPEDQMAMMREARERVRRRELAASSE
uniref:Uncharacterized protein n=1 Tax=Haliea sp. ETY-M TaxID=1055105 RepID=A0A455R719_9GAMM|nr:hypothetical protein [Haliea sp. ETY-M]